MIIRNSLFLLILFSSFTCTSQEVSNNIKKDLSLSEIYKKYYKNRYDYGEKEGEGRDSILNRFKQNLITTLKNKDYANCLFDSLKRDVKIIKSKDKKLQLFSWDELNGGTWHIYNVAYKYKYNNKLYADFLPIDEYGLLEAVHYKIVEEVNNSYLVKAYGTHGAGQDYYIYRLLSFKENKLVDCYKCFNGEDFFVFKKMRSYDIQPEYDSKSKEIKYPEMIPSNHEGEKTGFNEPSGKTLKLKYENGVFVKSNH